MRAFRTGVRCGDALAGGEPRIRWAAFFFSHLRGLTAGAVRLNIVGPLEAQALQHRLALRAQEMLARCAHLGVEDLAQTAPLFEVWQGAQDRLYSRLFQS